MTVPAAETATRGVEVLPNELIVAPDGLTRVKSTGQRVIEAGLVLTRSANRATPVPGLPFDDSIATVPHDAGRCPASMAFAITG